jgi:cytochrome c553
VVQPLDNAGLSRTLVDTVMTRRLNIHQKNGIDFMRIGYLLPTLILMLSATTVLAQGKSAQELIGACSRCHGEDGNTSGIYPDLAGQQKEYTVKQLLDFKSGARKNTQMSPMVGVLSEEDMHTLAEFYADVYLERQRKMDPDLVAQGKKVAKELNCASCHQPDYRGVATIPRLARQNRVYLVNQMKYFRDGKRSNDNGLKTEIMKNLTDDQIKVLSYYFTSM